jgi:hypothetical protein
MVEAVMPSSVTVIVTVPVPVPALTRPFDPEVSLTDAIAGFDDPHVTEEVRFLVVLFEYAPVAFN